jgi:hypothetical protein
VVNSQFSAAQVDALPFLRKLAALLYGHPYLNWIEHLATERRCFDAEGALTHLNNVAALLAEILAMADLTRVEVHGPATELEKLKKPLAHLNPAWFAIA